MVGTISELSGGGTSIVSSLVDPLTDPSAYDPRDNLGGNATFIKMGNSILGIIQTIGTLLAVVMLMSLGIKYMLGSTSEKAAYKQSMIPYLVGAIMLFTIPNIMKIVYDLVTAIDF